MPPWLAAAKKVWQEQEQVGAVKNEGKPIT
jgi:hypothetical protein